MPEIYLDNASTTTVAPEVLEAMLPYFSEKYGNPESLHSKGKESKIAIDEAKKTIAEILNCRPGELIFTGSATEANNLAILGFAHANEQKGRHLITSKIEHPSVIEPFKKLERSGFKVTWLNVDQYGFINPEELEASLKKETILVSIMYANNEIGTIEPISKLGEICAKRQITFHTDACQAAGELNLDVEKNNISLMTLNASKIYGPKGVGCLYLKRGLKLEPLIYGGGQESGFRSGTQNTAGIVGLATALKLIQKNNSALIELRDYFIQQILQKIPDARLNGHTENRLANNINISIPNIDAQRLILALDEKGIYCSTGSACNTGKSEPSHVLKAIDLPENLIESTLRFSLSKNTTKENLDYTAKILTELTSYFRHPHQNHHH